MISLNPSPDPRLAASRRRPVSTAQSLSYASDRTRRFLENSISSHPAVSVGAAAVVGVVLGCLLKRK